MQSENPLKLEFLKKKRIRLITRYFITSLVKPSQSSIAIFLSKHKISKSKSISEIIEIIENLCLKHVFKLNTFMPLCAPSLSTERIIMKLNSGYRSVQIEHATEDIPDFDLAGILRY